MRILRRFTLALALAGAVALPMTADNAKAAGEAKPPVNHSWSFEGVFGRYDRAQLQRGFRVYKDVCASCHGMELVAFRNLAEPGGPGFTEDQVKVIAADFLVTDGPNEDGDMFEREGTPADRFPPPFPNENAARAANGGAYPPDFSVLAKARPQGPDYLASLLKGYVDPPEGEEGLPGQYYNLYFPGHWFAMAPPLFDEMVEYTDGTPMTVEQYAEDVTAFMMWAAEPKLEERKRMGFQVMIFLLVLAIMMYFTKRKVWSNIEH